MPARNIRPRRSKANVAARNARLNKLFWPKLTAANTG